MCGVRAYRLQRLPLAEVKDVRVFVPTRSKQLKVGHFRTSVIQQINQTGRLGEGFVSKKIDFNKVDCVMLIRPDTIVNA